MDDFSEWITNLLNLGDPEIRTFFLIRHNYLPFILAGIYIVFSTILGPAIMKNRKPFELRNIMIVFNFLLVIMYSIFLFILAMYLPTLPSGEMCHGVTVKKGHISYTLARAIWIMYLVKYLEFFDTIFFVLRKKQNQVTFLHVVHHSLVPVIAWVALRTETSGLILIPVIVNSFVHVIMYSYYGLSAMGPQVQKHLWWKKYLTQLQMVQFVLILLFVIILPPLSGCRMNSSTYVLCFIINPLFLYLFYIFYKSSFQCRRISKETNRGGRKEPQVYAKSNSTEAADKTAKKLE